ncbi:MAG: site-2 protease family protein [Clostridiales bacterium]|jgi:regulator of sigma E protease|nr:site-2 protease family protein [Clostridiales bacterium]
MIFLKILEFIAYILVAFVCLSVMVVIHELGHFIAGRKLGFKINEFAVGMGPKIISKKLKSGLILSWRLIPLGGFCAFNGEDEDSPSSDAFNNQKPWKRLIVLFAGVFTNFVSAVIVLSLFFTFSGQTLPYIAPGDDYAAGRGVVYELDQDGEVETITIVTAVDGKAVQMLEPADFTNMLDGKDTVTLSVLVKNLKTKAVQKKEIVLERHTVYEYNENGEAVYNEDGTQKSSQKFGIQVSTARQTFGFFESIWRAFKFGIFTAVKILSSLGALITGSAKAVESTGGPITMISGLANIARTGIANTIYIICLFSVNLAIFNLLPLPALDGGRMVFTIIEWIRKKPIKRSVEAMIHFIGIVALFGIVILFDVLQLINKL